MLLLLLLLLLRRRRSRRVLHQQRQWGHVRAAAVVMQSQVHVSPRTARAWRYIFIYNR
jgi:hypothetical protein